MKNNTLTNKQSYNKTLFYLSIAVYLITLIAVSTLFIFPPNNFDIKSIIMPIAAILLISSLGLGYRITARSASRNLRIIGTILYAILMTFIGIFILASVMWFTGVYHAQ